MSFCHLHVACGIAMKSSGYSIIGLVIERSRVRVSPTLWPFANRRGTCISVTKQYNLVPLK